jgi:hypothetical protein
MAAPAGSPVFALRGFVATSRLRDPDSSSTRNLPYLNKRKYPVFLHMSFELGASGTLLPQKRQRHPFDQAARLE